ncbi:hypothetical protein T190611E02C_60125 [Tenacibaculum sp. 190524A05c]
MFLEPLKTKFTVSPAINSVFLVRRDNESCADVFVKISSVRIEKRSCFLFII